MAAAIGSLQWLSDDIAMEQLEYEDKRWLSHNILEVSVCACVGIRLGPLSVGRAEICVCRTTHQFIHLADRSDGLIIAPPLLHC